MVLELAVGNLNRQRRQIRRNKPQVDPGQGAPWNICNSDGPAQAKYTLYTLAVSDRVLSRGAAGTRRTAGWHLAVLDEHSPTQLDTAPGTKLKMWSTITGSRQNTQGADCDPTER